MTGDRYICQAGYKVWPVASIVDTSIKMKTAEVQKSRAYKPLTRFSFSLMKIREKKSQR